MGATVPGTCLLSHYLFMYCTILHDMALSSAVRAIPGGWKRLWVPWESGHGPQCLLFPPHPLPFPLTHPFPGLLLWIPEGPFATFFLSAMTVGESPAVAPCALIVASLLWDT